jgi:hypothetical protein
MATIGVELNGRVIALTPEQVKTALAKGTITREQIRINRGEPEMDLQIDQPRSASEIALEQGSQGIQEQGATLTQRMGEAYPKALFPASTALAKSGASPAALVPAALGEAALMVTSPLRAVGRKIASGLAGKVAGPALAATEIGARRIGTLGNIGGAVGEAAGLGAQGAIAQGNASGAIIPAGASVALSGLGAIGGNLRKMLPESGYTSTGAEIQQGAGEFLREAQKGTGIPADYIARAAREPEFLAKAAEFAGKEDQIGLSLLERAGVFDDELYQQVAQKMEGQTADLAPVIAILEGGKISPRVKGGKLTTAEETVNKQIDEKIAMLGGDVAQGGETVVGPAQKLIPAYRDASGKWHPEQVVTTGSQSTVRTSGKVDTGGYFGAPADHVVPMRDAWELRKDIDSQINYDAEGIDRSSAAKLQKTLAEANGALRKQINAVAGPEMAQFSRQIEATSDVLNLVPGRTLKDKAKNVQSFVDRLNGEGKAEFQRRLKAFDAEFNTDFADQVTWADAGQKFVMRPAGGYEFTRPMAEAPNDVNVVDVPKGKLLRDLATGPSAGSTVARKSPAGAVERFQYLDALATQYRNKETPFGRFAPLGAIGSRPLRQAAAFYPTLTGEEQ